MIENTNTVGDEFWMDRALALALEGWGHVSPNPLVGAAVVSGGRVIGEGFHAHYGGQHAEVVALTEGGRGTRGATLYVTLEPCAHRGLTPPCTEAIRRAGIGRVVYGCRDPDSQAAGGASLLRSTGLEVVGGVRSMSAARLNGSFIWDRLGLGPWVSVKLALSLDGRIAAQTGMRTRITGREAAAYVHRLRAGHDAIVVGGRTAMIDDPLLTVRLTPSPRIPPTRVVLDPTLQISADSRLVATLDEAPLLVLCDDEAPVEQRRKLERRGVEVATVGRGGEGLALDDALEELGSRGLRCLLVEGGGRLVAGLLAGGFVRKQHLIYAPTVFGSKGVPSVGASLAGTLTEDGDWSVVGREALGEDSLIELEDRRAREALMEVT